MMTFDFYCDLVSVANEEAKLLSSFARDEKVGNHLDVYSNLVLDFKDMEEGANHYYSLIGMKNGMVILMSLQVDDFILGVVTDLPSAKLGKTLEEISQLRDCLQRDFAALRNTS